MRRASLVEVNTDFISNFNNQQEVFAIIKNLAQEIQNMGDMERFNTLRKIIILELEGSVNKIWVNIFKVLLTNTELLPEIIEFAEKEIDHNVILLNRFIRS